MQRTYSVMDRTGKWSPGITEAQLFDYARNGMLAPDTMIAPLPNGTTFRAADHPGLASIFKQRGINIDPPRPQQTPRATSAAPRANNTVPPPPTSATPSGQHAAAPQTTLRPVLHQQAPAAPTPGYSAPVARNAAETYLPEAERQYRTLNWWHVIGLATIVATMGIGVVIFPFLLILWWSGLGLLVGIVIGISMLIYALIQKPALRRRVAEYGYDAQVWAKPLDAHFLRSAAIAVLFPIVLVGVLAGIGFANRIATSVTQGTNQGQQQTGQGFGSTGSEYLQSGKIALQHAQQCTTSAAILRELGPPTQTELLAGGAEIWRYQCGDSTILHVEIAPDRSVTIAKITY